MLWWEPNPCSLIAQIETMRGDLRTFCPKVDGQWSWWITAFRFLGSFDRLCLWCVSPTLTPWTFFIAPLRTSPQQLLDVTNLGTNSFPLCKCQRRWTLSRQPSRGQTVKRSDFCWKMLGTCGTWGTFFFLRRSRCANLPGKRNSCPLWMGRSQ